VSAIVTEKNRAVCSYCEVVSLCQHSRSFVSLTVLCCKLEDTSARDKFMYKLHRALLSWHLPLNYACLLCLAACWSTSTDVESSADISVLRESDVVSMLESNVARRRRLISSVPPSSLTSNRNSVNYCFVISKKTDCCHNLRK